MNTPKTKELLKIDVKKDFGAYGDGIHDDFNAIQNALDSLKDSGGTIWVPDGTYLITECLIIYSNQTLLLSDKAIIKRNSKVRYMLAVYTKWNWFKYSGTHDVTIIGGTFDGNESIFEKATIINTCHAKNVVIDGCKFIHGCLWHFIEINSTINALIKNCYFDGPSYTQIRPDGRSELIQIDTAFRGLYGPVYRNGKIMRFASDLTTCNGVTVQNCRFDCLGTPAFGMHTNYKHKNVKIIDNEINGTSNTDNSSRGMIILNSRPTKIEIIGNTFKSDVLDDKTNMGINIENKNKSACLVKNNTFIGGFKPYLSGGITEENNKFDK